MGKWSASHFFSFFVFPPPAPTGHISCKKKGSYQIYIHWDFSPFIAKSACAASWKQHSKSNNLKQNLSNFELFPQRFLTLSNAWRLKKSNTPQKQKNTRLFGFYFVFPIHSCAAGPWALPLHVRWSISTPDFVFPLFFPNFKNSASSLVRSYYMATFSSRSRHVSKKTKIR